MENIPNDYVGYLMQSELARLEHEPPPSEMPASNPSGQNCNSEGRDGCDPDGLGWVINGRWYCAKHWSVIRIDGWKETAFKHSRNNLQSGQSSGKVGE